MRQDEALRPRRDPLNRRPAERSVAELRAMEEERRLREAELVSIAEQAADAADPIAALGAAGKRPWYLDGRFVALAVLMGSVLLITVLAQTALFLNQIQTLPLPAQYLGYALGGVLALAALLALARLALLFVRLPGSPNVSIKALRELALRRDARERAATDAETAAREVEAFLKNFHLDRPQVAARLRRLGLPEADILELRRARQRLLDRERTGSIAWLESVEREFLPILDRAAKRRVHTYSLAAGVKTALFNHGAIDALVVLTYSYLMVGDLCSLYNLRTGRAGTLRIVAHMTVLAFVAANLEDVADSALDTAADAFAHDLGTIGAGIAGGAHALTRRGAQGAINYAILRRLGRVTTRELRPIAQPRPDGGLAAAASKLTAALRGADPAPTPA